jgi:DDE domain
LNNLIEQDHRRIKQRVRPMLGLKRFETAAVTIRGIELAEKIKKQQFNLKLLDGSPTHGGGDGAGHGGVLDLATPALGIQGTTLCQRGAPIRKTLRTKAEIITAGAFPATARSMHSLAQHHTAHSSKAHQIVQVDDTLPGKKKGFVDALPPGQELQADRARALNPDTIHSDLDDIVTRGLPPGQELQADRARALNPDAIHSDLDDIVTRGLPPGLELNLDRGKSLPPGWEAKVGPGTIVPDTDDTPATALRLLRSLTRIALRCCPQPILSRTTMTKQTQGGIWLLFSVQRCFSCGDSFLTPRHNLCPTGHVQSTPEHQVRSRARPRREAWQKAVETTPEGKFWQKEQGRPVGSAPLMRLGITQKGERACQGAIGSNH